MIFPSQLEPLPVDVISIQSQVAYGCVGNSVAVPTLQALGFNVVSVPTVLLSNVPHYDTLSGGPLPQEWFEGFLSDIERRGVLKSARAVLVGYLGSAQQAEALAQWLERAVTANPQLLVVLDPVMGDHDSGIYVHPDLPEALRSRLTPLASGIAPNSFEFERIVGNELPTIEETVAAARDLLQGRTEWAVVTSAAHTKSEPGELQIAIVTRSGEQVISYRRIDSAAKGTGDLFSAALLGALLDGYDLAVAVESAHRRVAVVLERTRRRNCAELVLNEV